jgi:hypothetical protein
MLAETKSWNEAAPSHADDGLLVKTEVDTGVCWREKRLEMVGKGRECCAHEGQYPSLSGFRIYLALEKKESVAPMERGDAGEPSEGYPVASVV